MAIEEIHFQRCWRPEWPPMPHSGDRLRITGRGAASPRRTDPLDHPTAEPGDIVTVELVWLAMDEVCVEVRYPTGKDALWAFLGDRWEIAG
jgi:hypothetical protein